MGAESCSFLNPFQLSQGCTLRIRCTVGFSLSIYGIELHNLIKESMRKLLTGMDTPRRLEVVF